MPGRKLTMLPEGGGRRVHAAAGRDGAGAVALRRDRRRTACRSRTRRGSSACRSPRTCACDAISDAFANALPSPADPPWTHELRALWKLAQHLSAQRGKTDVNRIDYSFDVDWDADADGRVAIVPRERGSPLDKLVAELMIHVNNTWGTAARRARAPRASTACRPAAR